jgi:stage II sporulation protein D
VLNARIVGANGSRDLGKDVTRYYFGLRSTLFTIALRPEEIEFVSVVDIPRMRQLELLGATRERSFYNVRDPERPALAAVTGMTYRVPARFVFQGRGYGHGVGMSQWGAQGMALVGKSAEQILKHYYRGIALTNIGGA